MLMRSCGQRCLCNEGSRGKRYSVRKRREKAVNRLITELASSDVAKNAGERLAAALHSQFKAWQLRKERDLKSLGLHSVERPILPGKHHESRRFPAKEGRRMKSRSCREAERHMWPLMSSVTDWRKSM